MHDALRFRASWALGVLNLQIWRIGSGLMVLGLKLLFRIVRIVKNSCRGWMSLRRWRIDVQMREWCIHGLSLESCKWNVIYIIRVHLLKHLKYWNKAMTDVKSESTWWITVHETCRKTLYALSRQDGRFIYNINIKLQPESIKLLQSHLQKKKSIIFNTKLHPKLNHPTLYLTHRHT